MSRIVGLVLVCLLLLAVAPLIGTTDLADVSGFILWQLRVPRVVVGALVGATLGITGAAFQALFGNPLATPSTTGTTAGAALGALAALVLLTPTDASSGLVVAACAFAGALVVSLPVALFARRRQARLEDVLLAGIALTLAAGAISTGLQFQADLASTYQAVQWSLGSLSQVGYAGVSGLLPLATVCCVGILLHRRALEALVSGEERAFSQGVDVSRVRSGVLVLGSLGVAGCVAWCGPIAFVGLVVPHIVRLSLGPVRRILLPMSGVAGAAFLVSCDALARVVLDGVELPVGVVTATLGAPLLIFLVLTRSRPH